MKTCISLCEISHSVRQGGLRKRVVQDWTKRSIHRPICQGGVECFSDILTLCGIERAVTGRAVRAGRVKVVTMCQELKVGVWRPWHFF